MEYKNNGGPAFPAPEFAVHRDLPRDQVMKLVNSQGMTLRDYFAAKAMQGFAADPEAAWKDGAAGMARCAYEWADAMLAERERV